jgi:hypothetical protein
MAMYSSSSVSAAEGGVADPSAVFMLSRFGIEWYRGGNIT